MSGWPSPTVGNATGSQMAKDASPTGRRPDGSKATVSLPQVASFAGWPTTQASDGSGGGQMKRALNPARSNDLMDFAMLAGWSTASARDWKDTAGMATEAVNPDGSTRTRLDQLPRQAQIAGWPTARAADGEKNVRTAEGALSEIERKGTPQDLAQGAAIAGWPTPDASNGNGGKGPRKGVSMSGRMPDGSKVTMDLSASVKLAMDHTGPARFTASGETLIGSCAGMESGGQLNPDLSRWLMGYPAEWGSCGATAMQSIRTRRQSSSGRSTKAACAPMSSAMIAWLLAA